MQLEEAIERLNNKLNNDKDYLERSNPFSEIVHEIVLDNRAIETVLQALDNSIPKQVVEEKIKEYERRKEGLNDIEASVRLDVKIRAYKELLKESK